MHFRSIGTAAKPVNLAVNQAYVVDGGADSGAGQVSRYGFFCRYNSILCRAVSPKFLDVFRIVHDSTQLKSTQKAAR